MVKYIISILLILLSSNVNSKNFIQKIDPNESIYKKPYEIKFNLFESNIEQKLFIGGLSIKLEPGWKIFWRNPGDAGLPPKLNLLEAENFKNSKLLFPAPRRFNFVDIKTFGYKNKIIFPVEIHAKNNLYPLKGTLKFEAQICNKICMPIEENFKIFFSFFQNISGNKDKDFFKSKRLVPKENRDKHKFFSKIKITNNLLKIYFAKNFVFDHADLIIEDKNLKILPEAKFIKNVNEKYAVIDLNNINFNKNLTITFISDQVNFFQKFQILNENVDKAKIIKKGFFNILIISLLAGIILNFMPCVLPVLSIKLVKFVSLIEVFNVFEVRKRILLQIVGIVSSFILLSTIVGIIKFSGNQIGWGFQFQNNIFLLSITVVIIFFSLNLYGFFEISLPNFVLSKLSKLSLTKYEDFLSGFLMTILATPCTAPIVGSAITFALAGNIFEIFFVFFAMSLGLSLPLLIIYVFPRFIFFLPRSGKWLIIFKRIMASLLMLTGLWLCSIYLKNIGKNLNFFKNESDLRWINWDIKNESFLINKLILENKIIFLDITASWCITCQYNKNFVIDTDNVKDVLKKNNVVLLRLDWTKENKYIEDFLFSKNRYGIPFNQIYSRKFSEGYILPELLKEEIVIKTINEAK